MNVLNDYLIPALTILVMIYVIDDFFREYCKKHLEKLIKLKEWYQNQSGPLQRFLKYGGWIALQFWIIRAPMTVWFTGRFPEIISLDLIINVLEFPGYLLASFTSGTILAIVGFVLSERWIWRPKKDEV